MKDIPSCWIKLSEIIQEFEELSKYFKSLSKRQKIWFSILSVLILVALVHFSGVLVPTITQVMLSDYSLSMNTGDVDMLSATVLYSNNTEDSKVFWVSSNKAVAQVDENGQLTAISAGSTTITAQAANRKSTQSAECIVTVTDSLKGYSISVQRTAVENYIYIYVQPEDDDVSQIILYAQAPSGKIYTPAIDENDLYRFYAEEGIWTIYATLKGQRGIYEANKPEDFVIIEVNDVSPTERDAQLAGLPVNR